MRIGIYSRFSVESNDEHQHQSSLENQKNEGIEFCKKHNYSYKVYSDINSRDILFDDRENGRLLIDDIVNKEIDGVWVLREDRIGEFNSSVPFKVILKKHNCKYFVDNREVDFDNDGDYLITNLLSMMSTIDRRNIKKRCHRGRKSRIKRGLWVGVLPYGFLPNKHKIEFDEEKIKKVVECHKVFVDRDWKDLRSWIIYCQNVIGVKTTPMWYYDLFRKTQYNGRKTFEFKDGFKHTITYRKVVDDKLFEKFISKGKKTIKFNQSNNRKRDFKNLLKGLVYCKVCKRRLNIHSTSKKVKKLGNKRRKTFRCRYGWDDRGNQIHFQNQIKKHTTTFGYDELSNSIYEMLVNLLFNSNLIKNEFKRKYNSNVDISKYQKEIELFEKKLKQLKSREFQLEEKYIDNLISEENIVKHKEKIQLERLIIEGNIESIKDDIYKVNSSNEILSWIDRFKKEYSVENMLKKTFEEKRKLIVKYINRIDVVGSLNKGYEIDIKLNIPIYDDKIKLDKRKYWEFVNNGGNKKEWKKEWKVEDGKNMIRSEDIKSFHSKKKMLLNNQKININLRIRFNTMAHGVTGNTSGFGPEESRFEP